MQETRFLLSEHCAFIRWTHTTVADLNEWTAMIVRQHEKVRRPMIYCGVQYSDFQTPDAATRKLAISAARDLLLRCKAYYVVMHGDGISASMNRAVLRTMILGARAVGVDTSKVVVADTVHAVVAREKDDLPMGQEQLLQALRERGIVEG